MASEPSRKIKNLEIAEVDTITREDSMQARDVRALCLSQLVNIALHQKDVLFGCSTTVKRDALNIILKAAHIIHAAGTKQLAEQIDQARTADALGWNIADDSKAKGLIIGNRHRFDCSIQRRHATRDGSALESGASGTRGRQNAMLVAHDQLGIRPDIHDRNETLFMGEIHRQHAC